MLRSLSIFFIIIICVGSCSEPPRQRFYPKESISCADMAFRCGEGVFSRLVTINEEDGVFSHIGVVVKHDGKWMVAHAVPRESDFKGDFARVKLDDLDVFFSSNRAVKGCLVHPGLLDTAEANAICRNAINAALDSVRFDNKYDLDDSLEVYCTEFVWRLFMQQGIDLSEGRRRHIHTLHINDDILLPEHILEYQGNSIYYSF